MTTKNVDPIDVEKFLAHFGVKGMRWGVEDFDEVAKNIAASGFTRLDNAPLNTAFLMRWLKDAA